MSAVQPKIGEWKAGLNIEGLKVVGGLLRV